MRMTVTIKRYLEVIENGEPACIEKDYDVDVKFDVEPTEYEGTYLLYQGGTVIESASVNGEDIELDPYEMDQAIEKIKLYVDVPVHTYPFT